MNLKEITKEYLEKNGYDGLFNSDGECGCEKDDLFPCMGESCALCEPGYKGPCDPEDCGEHMWHIMREKPSGA